MIDTKEIFLKVRRRDVAYLCGLFTFVSEVAVIRTPHPEKSEIQELKFMVSCGMEKEFERIIGAIKKEDEKIILS